MGSLPLPRTPAPLGRQTGLVRGPPHTPSPCLGAARALFSHPGGVGRGKDEARTGFVLGEGGAPRIWAGSSRPGHGARREMPAIPAMELPGGAARGGALGAAARGGGGGWRAGGGETAAGSAWEVGSSEGEDKVGGDYVTLFFAN